jgi:hypothetical protein
MKTAGKRLLFQLACIIGLAHGASGVLANDNNQNGNTIQGTWLARVTIPNPPPGVPGTFLSLHTFMGTGEAIEANSTTQDRGLGQGEWAKAPPGAGHFVRTLTYFVYGTGHVFTQFTRVTTEIELAPDGETYTATSHFQNYDTNGVLLNSGDTTAVAHRCGMGDSVPSCIPQ